MYKIEKNKNPGLDDYEGMAFVMAAMAKDPYPNNLHERIMFDGACFWATDGHRVHYYYVHNNDFVPGVYEIVSKDKKTVVINKKEDVIYPDISSLDFFRGLPKWNVEIETSAKDNIKMSRSREYTKIVRRFPSNQTINFEFFESLPPDSYTVYYYGPEKIIGFSNHSKGAGIMPLRVK